ncbi:ComF family protein [Candidatus Omnitrophota bacterium]
MTPIELLQSCISVLLPMRCSTCGNKPASYPMSICPSCRNKILSQNAPPAIQSKRITRILSCRSYEGLVRECIKSFKYRGDTKLLDVFEEVIEEFIYDECPFTRNIDFIVPVPMHPSRRLKRGYNQAELISRLVSKTMSLPSISTILLKARDTKPQMSLDRRKRTENLKNSFVVADRLSVTGKAILLVDDIITTGATLDMCASQLLSAGARSVDAFTLARTL